MRFLIGVLAVILGSACYGGAADDCQFRCGTGSACPSGTSCRGGFCRSTSAGTCSSAAVDAAVDASIDSTNCPAVPPSCGSAFSFSGTCAAICTSSKTWFGARDHCTAPWGLALLDTTAKLEAVPTQNDDYWVGAMQGGDNIWRWRGTTVVRDDAWSGGSAPIGGDSCARVPSGQHVLDSRVCDDTLSFVCTAP